MANRFLSNIKINDAYTFPASDGTNGQVIKTDGSGNLSFAQLAADSASVMYKDTFTGNGSTTAFTLANALNDEVQSNVYIDGVYQSKSTYSVSGTTLTFSTAPASGHEIEVISTTGINSGPTAIYTDTFTANGSATAFTLGQTVHDENQTIVFLNGVYQFKGTYALSGTTLTLDTAPANGVAIEVMSIGSAYSGGDILYDHDFASAGLMTTNGSGVYSITANNSANWNTAYGWGDHSTQSYATQSYVGTQISNLVDSSPATLDTLNELAAALGDDPNFATTTATSIGLKAPKASPSFTGTPSFTLNDGVFIKAINGTNNIASTNVWGYGLYEGASKLGEISLVRDGSSSQMYIGTTGANQVLRIGSANKVTALTLDASQNATFAGTIASGNIAITNSGNGELSLTRTSGATVKNIAQSARGQIGTSSNHELQLITNSTSRLTISNSGNSTFAGEVTLSAETQYLNFKKASTADVIASIISQTDAGTGGKLRFLTKRNGDTQVDALVIDDNQNSTFAGNVESQGLYVGTTNTSFDFYNNGTTYLNGATTIDFDTIINGKTTFNTNANTTFKIETAGTNAVYMRAASGDEVYLGANNTWQLRFQTNNNVTMDNNGSFGIGTSSPTGKLNVEAPGNHLHLRAGTAAAGKYWNFDVTANNQLFIITDGNNGMNITNTGNVGIGTTSPDLGAVAGTRVLTIASPTAERWGILELAGNRTWGGNQVGELKFISTDSTNNGTLVSLTAINDPTSTGTGGSLKFSTRPNGGSLTERMRITSGGVVEIGSPPSTAQSIAKLDVRVNGSAIEFGHTNNGDWYYGTLGAYGSAGNPFISFSTFCEQNDNRWTTQGNKGNIITNDGNGALVFQQVTSTNTTNQAAVDRMRLTSNGTFLVNQTTPSTTADGFGVHPTGSGGGNLVSCYNGTGNTALILGHGAYDGTVVDFRRGSTQVGTISVSTSATQYNTSSDYRLKEDLQNFEGLGMVSKIPVYDFKWKSGESRSYGVMAHELQEVLPQAVSGEKDAEEMQGVDYSKIVPLLVKSIQELKADNDGLRARIKTLENN